MRESVLRTRCDQALVFATALAADGYHVIVGARRRDRIDALAATIGGTAHTLDVTDAQSVDSFCRQIANAKILVNNAGGALGLDFNCTAGQTVNCWAIDNIFNTVGMCIDSEDNSTTSGLLVVGNQMITDIDTDNPVSGYDFVLGRAVDNRLTGSGSDTDAIPYVLDA